jgi:spore maturation protein CgeB
MKAAMVMERTDDHEDLFGPEGTAALYFETVSEMVEKVRWLLDHPDKRHEMAREAHRLIIDGKHTYRDRLQTILREVEVREPSCFGEPFPT